MRTLLCLVALFALSAAVALPHGKFDSITDRMRCVLCEDIIKDSEKWLGDEEGSHEGGIVKKCENFFGGDNNALSKYVCDNLLKNDLDNILRHLEDPTSEKKDSKKACQQIGMCTAY